MPSDVDMSTSDTTGTGCTRCRDIYQVNSSSSFKLYFYIILDKNTTRSVVLSTVSKYLYKPRVKIRLWNHSMCEQLCACARTLTCTYV
jgi:hypothetical protein